MTARMEIYDSMADPDDGELMWVLTGEVPRVGDHLWLNAMDKGRYVKVQRVEWWFDHEKNEEIPQVALYVSDQKPLP